MGYYVDVKLAVSKKGYDKLKELHITSYPEDEFLLDKAGKKFSNDKGIVVFEFDFYKDWHVSDDCTKLKKLLSEINKQGYGYNLIVVGEDIDDVFEEFESGSSKEEDFSVIEYTRRIDLTTDEVWTEIN